MHELSVCQALLTQVTDIAMDHGASAVVRIIVEVGPLSGIEPHLLASAFEVVRAGSCAAKAELSIESMTITVACLICGAQSPCRPNRLICAACGGFRTRVLAGDELRLRTVELRVPEPQGASVGKN